MPGFGVDRRMSHHVAGMAGVLGEGGPPTERRQDKRGPPDGIQAIDMACLRPGASVGSRAARGRKTRHFKHQSGTGRFPTPRGVPR